MEKRKILALPLYIYCSPIQVVTSVLLTGAFSVSSSALFDAVLSILKKWLAFNSLMEGDTDKENESKVVVSQVHQIQHLIVLQMEQS
ncbi:hypothetical protein POPTR_001G372850v4 [Populus trichocarpa]|uniref:Uncharacterized protein n=1 Tax=Populus trichocarpa TaxID=3694 RepID=A0ACC0TNR5_POPTR|nr:hypothetical protein POPTR_001G372850v4 [Populus trichocarpa]